jgi:hypothetical protein
VYIDKNAFHNERYFFWYTIWIIFCIFYYSNKSDGKKITYIIFIDFNFSVALGARYAKQQTKIAEILQWIACSNRWVAVPTLLNLVTWGRKFIMRHLAKVFITSSSKELSHHLRSRYTIKCNQWKESSCYWKLNNQNSFCYKIVEPHFWAFLKPNRSIGR